MGHCVVATMKPIDSNVRQYKVHADILGGSVEKKRHTCSRCFNPTTGVKHGLNNVHRIRNKFAGLKGVDFGKYADGKLPSCEEMLSFAVVQPSLFLEKNTHSTADEVFRADEILDVIGLIRMA